MTNKEFQQYCKNGDIEQVKLGLKDELVTPNSDKNYAFRLAAANGRTDIVALLLSDKRIDPSDDYNDAIIEASTKGHSEVVKLLLLDKRVDPSAQSDVAIKWAATENHIEVVKLLLADKRVDPSADNNEAISNAAYKNHSDMVRLLLTDPSVLKYEPLYLNDIIVNNNLDLFTEILSNLQIKLDIRLGNNLLSTIILNRSKNPTIKLEMFELLMRDPRINPAYYEFEGHPFIFAVENQDLEIVKLFLEDGRVDPSIAKNRSIKWASRYGFTEIFKMLYNHPKVDITVDKNYCVVWAKKKKHTEIYNLLISDHRVIKKAIDLRQEEFYEQNNIKEIFKL